jgi:hypothetical protein
MSASAGHSPLIPLPMSSILSSNIYDIIIRYTIEIFSPHRVSRVPLSTAVSHHGAGALSVCGTARQAWGTPLPAPCGDTATIDGLHFPLRFVVAAPKGPPSAR